MNLLVVIGSLFFCLVLGEIVIRIIKPQEVGFTLLRLPDKNLGFRLKPNSYVTLHLSIYKFDIQTNSEGLRDREFVIPKPPGVFRIVALGDSFTFGFAVPMEQSYPKQLEKLLNERLSPQTGLKYEVVNTGVFDYGPIQYDYILRNHAMQYQPDLVIMGLFPMNDVDDVLHGVEELRRTTEHRRLCMLYTYLHGKYVLYSCLKEAQTGNVSLPAIAQDHYSPEFIDALEQTQKYISDDNQYCLKYHTPFLLAIFPYDAQVLKMDKSNKLLSNLYTDKVFENNMVRMSSQFAEFASQNNIPNLDLLPAFRASKSGLLYNPFEGHWNPEGNKLAAETLFSYLTTHNLVPITHP